MMDIPTKLPYGVSFDRNDYSIIRGDIIVCRANTDGSPVYTNDEIKKLIDITKTYKVWYNESTASDPADTTYHRYIYYIEGLDEINAICCENDTMRRLMNEALYYCNKPTTMQCILEAFKEGIRVGRNEVHGE